MKLYEIYVSEGNLVCRLFVAKEDGDFTVRLPWWKVFLVRIAEAIYDKAENWMLGIYIRMDRASQEQYEKDHPRKLPYREN